MEYVWVKAPDEDGQGFPFGAQIIERHKKYLRVRNDDGKESDIRWSDVLQPMHPSCINDAEDMIMLGDLQEFTILRNLHLRYKKKLIYTYTGNVLIAVNPYQELPIYGNDFIAKYNNKKLGELPPHLYAIGDASYEKMMVAMEKQCIIINGESGAGKTRSAKILLQYYAAKTGKHSDIEEQILMSNPVLEAFGNAKTVRNDNSSRFGKYTSIYFNYDGKIEKAEIKQFLLEKSRIVSVCSGERNYHIFYMLVKGLFDEEKGLLGLKEVSYYKYLSEEVINKHQDKREIVEFKNFRKAMKILNFGSSIEWGIYELLAAILHLGNVMYNEYFTSGIESVEVVESKDLNFISKLLGVPLHRLKLCLTKKSVSTLHETVSKQLNKQEAIDARDAFAKTIYGNLFNFIVCKINEEIKKNVSDCERSIGILDIFGFENFERNSFEQLCINLANESLQQFFIKYTFKLEQTLYINDDISWEFIDFVDNKEIIQMLSIEPMNIISIINDQSIFPSGTDESLLNSLIEHHEQNRYFLTPKFNNIQTFGVSHFAGIVLYDVKDFLEKNRDSCTRDFADMATMSESDLLKRIFAGCNSGSSKKRISPPTCAAKFQNSLEELMSELNRCHPFFVRCIKPNNMKEPNLFDRKLCGLQLAHSGIRETSKIRQAGYPVRPTYREFVSRYGMIQPREAHWSRMSEGELKEVTHSICNVLFGRNVDCQFGRTRLFLRNAEYLLLEKKRDDVLTNFAVVIQKSFRAWLYRKRFLKMRRGAIVIQRCWRARRLRSRYNKTRSGIIKLQAVLRMRYSRILYFYLRRVIIRLQARCKGFAVRKKIYQTRQMMRAKQAEAIGYSENHRTGGNQRPKAKPRHKERNLVGQESYLHGRYRKNPTRDAFQLVDESFNFLDAFPIPSGRNKSKRKQ